MTDLALLGISGSLRAASSNTKLVHQAARHFGEAEFMLADLRLPLFDQDIQDGPGIPPEVQLLSDQIAFADAVVISTPEYNKAISGVLKNALDWVSRTEGNPWRDKPVAVMSSAAWSGGGREVSMGAAFVSEPIPSACAARSGNASGRSGQGIQRGWRVAQ